MTRVAILATLLALPTIAAADNAGGPPGECHTCVVPASASAPRPHDMARRIGVGARAVSLSLADEAGSETQYSGGGFAASYRISRRWEIALALDMLDAPQGPDLHATLLSARFHITPHRPWDWYVLAGIGGVREAPPEGEQVTHDDDRGQVHAGVGLQRRFRWVGISAELHAVSVEARHDVMASPRAMPEAAAKQDLSGGELTVAAMFFF